MTKALTLSACLLLLGLINSAAAGVIQVGTGYEVSYQMVLNTPTATGNDILDTIIFEWNDSVFNADYSYTIAGSGRTVLSHTIDFDPTSALVLGYLDGTAGIGDGKRHLYMLADSAYTDYLSANLIGQKFSTIFGVGEQFTIDLLIEAATGNNGALADLQSLVTNEFSPAAFDPAGGFKILKWSDYVGPVGNSIPEPTTLALMGFGLAGLGYRRKRK